MCSPVCAVGLFPCGRRALVDLVAAGDLQKVGHVPDACLPAEAAVAFLSVWTIQFGGGAHPGTVAGDGGARSVEEERESRAGVAGGEGPELGPVPAPAAERERAAPPP